MSILSEIIALIGKNGEVVDIAMRKETKDRAEVKATIKVGNDYREQIYSVKKESNTQ